MSDNYWEHVVGRLQQYIDGDTGRIIGSVTEQFYSRKFVAEAYGKSAGDYAKSDDARDAVEAACVAHELAAQQAVQAAGDSE